MSKQDTKKQAVEASKKGSLHQDLLKLMQKHGFKDAQLHGVAGPSGPTCHAEIVTGPDGQPRTRIVCF